MIRVLDNSVARRIAAGEIIERPSSVVRELLDNALDAGAKSIEVRIVQGGVDEIVVQDDGMGMSPEDLALCWYSHATSKIRTEEDLQTVTSLGFRGEALSSIAAVSRLEVISRSADAEVAHRLVVAEDHAAELGAAPGALGTRVQVSGLFASLPARRRFLRRPATESRMVREVVMEKAIAFPEVGFRFFIDGAVRHHLPPGDRLTRITSIYPELVDLKEVAGEGPGFAVSVATPGPGIWRNDRKLIQSFVNRRRVWEYAFVQAAEYGYQGYLPGGRHPVAFVFLDVSPELVDFNVHPTKREARFKDLPTIHRKITETLRSLSRSFALKVRSAGASTEGSGTLAFDAGPSGAPKRLFPAPGVSYDLRRSLDDGVGSGLPSQREPGGTAPGSTTPEGLRYLGQLFGVFLLAEADNVFYIIDQHAAHERLLYEKIAQNAPTQRLLHPIPLDVEEELARHLEEQAGRLGEIGVELRRNEEDGGWEIASVPASAAGSPGALVDTLTTLEFDEGNLRQEFFAVLACKAAIKEGDSIDRATALSLIEETFALDNARCPHGRPVWHAVSREELYRLVGRT